VLCPRSVHETKSKSEYNNFLSIVVLLGSLIQYHCRKQKQRASKIIYYHVCAITNILISYLTLRQVNSLSWLYVVWKKNFFSTGKLSREDMSMTVILLRMHSHIDTGKRFNDRQDRKDEEVISTRSHDHSLGYTGFSLDDFKCVHRIKSCSFKKRFAPVFKIWPHKNLKNMFLQPISAVCDAIYQGMFALLYIIRQC